MYPGGDINLPPPGGSLAIGLPNTLAATPERSGAGSALCWNRRSNTLSAGLGWGRMPPWRGCSGRDGQARRQPYQLPGPPTERTSAGHRNSAISVGRNSPLIRSACWSCCWQDMPLRCRAGGRLQHAQPRDRTLRVAGLYFPFWNTSAKTLVSGYFSVECCRRVRQNPDHSPTRHCRTPTMMRKTAVLPQGASEQF